jgi:hypothetical protein
MSDCKWLVHYSSQPQPTPLSTENISLLIAEPPPKEAEAVEIDTDNNSQIHYFSIIINVTELIYNCKSIASCLFINYNVIIFHYERFDNPKMSILWREFRN